MGATATLTEKCVFKSGMATQSEEAPQAEEVSGNEAMERMLDRMEGYTVVDSDIHEMIFDVSKFAEYMDDPWKRKVEHLARTTEPLTQGIGGSYEMDVNPSESGEGNPYGLEKNAFPTKPSRLENFMEMFNTDYVILHGHVSLLFSGISNSDFTNALYSATNDLLLNEWLDQYNGIKATIRVGTQDPQAAVEEIDRVGDEDGFVGIHLPGGSKKMLGDPEVEPIYQVAEEKGLGIDVHPSRSNSPWAKDYAAPSVLSTAENLSTTNQQMMAQLSSMVFNGIPAKYPDLNFVFMEHGITWIPWLLGRMDKTFERREHAMEWLDTKPSEQVRESFFFGTQPIEDVPGPGALKRIFDMMQAEDLLVYTTDFPHFDFDYPSMLTIPSQSEEEERQIFGENAMEVFDI
jgi:predicted TIM-barrel fold metal-dependent hydrolase